MRNKCLPLPCKTVSRATVAPRGHAAPTVFALTMPRSMRFGAEEQRLIAEWVPEFQRVASEQAIAALAQADGMAMWRVIVR